MSVEATLPEHAGAAAPPVRVDTLNLVDFRNYSTLRLHFDRGFVVFVGANGAGKTNLLESLSLLSPGRGLRRALLQDIARKGGSGGFALKAGLTSQEMAAEVAIKVKGDGGGPTAREILIDGTAARAADELLDLVRVVWLTPSMDGLFTGPAGDRRRFLDRMVLAVDPGHGRRASDYERAMRSRNRLLSDNRLDIPGFPASKRRWPNSGSRWHWRGSNWWPTSPR